MRHAIEVGGKRGPRCFLIGWINQSARLSLERHSGDLMHQQRVRTNHSQTIHALNHSLLHPTLSLRSKLEMFHFGRSPTGKQIVFFFDECENMTLLARPLLERPFKRGKVPGTNLIDSKGINWRPDGHSYDKPAPTHTPETWYIQGRKRSTMNIHNFFWSLLAITLHIFISIVTHQGRNLSFLDHRSHIL